jgi:hypothetical protein
MKHGKIQQKYNTSMPKQAHPFGYQYTGNGKP